MTPSHADLLREKILDAGVPDDLILGCSSAEIARIEQSHNVILLPEYRRWLVLAGKCAAPIGLDVFYPEIISFRDEALLMLTYTHSSPEILNGKLVCGLVGDSFLYFEAEDRNYYTYRFDADDAIIEWCGSYWDILNQNLDDIINYYKVNDGRRDFGDILEVHRARCRKLRGGQG